MDQLFSLQQQLPELPDLRGVHRFNPCCHGSALQPS